MPPSEDAAQDHAPGDRVPGDRAREGGLARPPGDRYRPAAPLPPDEDRPAPSTGRAVSVGTLVAIGGAVVFALLGGLLSMTAGLLVVAGAIGWLIGRTVATAAAGAATQTRRSVIATVLAVDGVVLGLVGIWLVASLQGGRLGLLDYLAQTRGLLAPIEVGVAAVAAWWSAR